MDVLNSWEKPLDIAIAIGTPSTLKTVVERIVNQNVSFPNVIHPDFLLNDPETFTIGKGNIINRGCSCS